MFNSLFQISGLEDIYVFDGGLVYLDTNGSIATNHVPAIVSLKSLHVQDKGTFQLKAYHDAYTWDIDITNITVSSFILKVPTHLGNYIFEDSHFKMMEIKML